MNEPNETEPSAWDPDDLENNEVDLDAVYSDGYVSFQVGISEDECPYSEDERLETAWLTGWHDARVDEFEGEASYE